MYSGKDYEGECGLIVEAVQRFGLDPTRSILDLGCGTGGHAIPLARRGYEVVGVDRSCPGRDERGTHVMRFFFPLELELLCELEQLELVSLTPFGTLDGEVDRSTWNVTAVARAR